MTLGTFGVSDSNTTVLKLPKKRYLWKVPTFRIQERLKALGYDTANRPASMITFKRALTGSFPALQEILRKKYQKRYPTLIIRHITIEPTGSKLYGFTLEAGSTIRLPESSLRKKSGTFVVRRGKKRDYFRYEIEGTIKVYKANHQIKKDKMIDSNNVHTETIPFEKFYAPPVTDVGNGRYIAKQNIAGGKVLTKANVGPLPAVLKGSRVQCFYKEGPVVIEFDAEALQNGYIGDTVLIKKGGGKVLRGTVVESKRVELK
ncbi:flagellar basal body P-ring formation chaperone FlgA [Hydrogenimonas sp.]